jgi:cytochrome P450
MHETPHDVDFRRKSKRTLTFSTGPHTCAGMHLARTEIRIALEAWMQRMPALRLAPDATIKTATESVWALETLPLVWG